MAKTETLNLEVKSNIKSVTKDTDKMADSLDDVNKEAKAGVGNFTLMGVSLNGVKNSFAKIIPTAKLMFGSLKAGLISTGIGAFVIAVGSLVAFFKSTKRGAELLEKALAGIGAVVSVITDRLSSFGEVIVAAFENPKQAVADLWQAIKTNLLNRVQGMIDAFGFAGKAIESALDFDWDGVKENAAGFTESMVQVASGVDDLTGKMAEGFKSLADEINNDVDAAIRLKGLTQQLRDEEREFSKVRAQTRQDIQKARLDALDETKTVEERLKAVQKANDLELKTTEDVLEMQRKKIQIQKETMALSENMAEDLDELAALEVGLIDLQTASFQTQKRLATEMETLTNEIAANEKAAQKVIDDEKAAQDKKEIDDAKTVADAKIKEAKRVAKEEEALTKAVESFKESSIKKGFGIAASLAGENTALSKGVAAAQVVYNTQQAIMAAMAATSVADKLLPYPLRLANAIGAGVMGAQALKKVMSTSPSGAGAEGGSVSAPATQTPAPEMMSGAFTLSGGQEVEPARAYVVSDDITNNQNKLAIIRRRATI